MNDIKIIIPGIPRTKKTSQMILPTGKRRVLQSKNYREYENACLIYLSMQYKIHGNAIEKPINLKILVYKKDRIKSDLVGYLQSLSDILVKAGFIKDDNFNIVKGYDDSRIFIDRDKPRVEITISKATP